MKPSLSLRVALRSLQHPQCRCTTSSMIRPHIRLTPTLLQQHQTSRFLSTTPYRRGIAPESSNPAPPKTESHDSPSSPASAADLSDSEYHEISDQYLNTLVLALEEKAETSDALEVEYAAGVLTITHPRGVYVLNKQPPNKQIWLSSPVSGPKRYDWVIKSGAGMHEKEGSESLIDSGDDGRGGKWVYLRDGSELSELLRREVGVSMVSEEDEGDVRGGREGPAGGGSGMVEG